MKPSPSERLIEIVKKNPFAPDESDVFGEISAILDEFEERLKKLEERPITHFTEHLLFGQNLDNLREKE